MLKTFDFILIGVMTATATVTYSIKHRAELKLEEVRRLGDIASGVTMPLGELAQIYGKARVQGRLFAEDMNQLTGRGIPIIGEIAKQLGIADSEVKKYVEKGEVNFGMIEQAFISLTSEGGRFHDMMKEQSKTMAAIASTANPGSTVAPSCGFVIPSVGATRSAMPSRWLRSCTEFWFGRHTEPPIPHARF